jgi:hypothetical protein
MLHQTTLNQPQNKKDDLATFSSLPLHLTWQLAQMWDLWHVPGSSNKVADVLSRPAAAVAVAVPAPVCVDYAALAAAQSECEDTQNLALDSSLHVEAVEVAGARLLCDTLTGVLRQLVPTNQRRAVFEAMHRLAHPGTCA